MSEAKTFCTCERTSCPRHPTNHDQGCTPCIELNLALRKIPTCFFAAADPDRTWQGFDFEEFARIVTEQAAKKAAQTNEED